MKRFTILALILTAMGLVFATPGCGGGHKSSRSSTPGGGGAGGGGSTGGGGTGTGTGTGGGNSTGGTGTITGSGGWSLGEYCKYQTPQGFLGYINEKRSNYAGLGGHGYHDRYKGIPWKGGYHNNDTFAVQFTWDDGLAARAQTEADSLAGGSSPKGTDVKGQGDPHHHFWVDGLNTADWMLSCSESPGDWEVPEAWKYSGYKPFALNSSNGSARQGLFYHDFGGDGPAITKIGIGTSYNGTITWWVLQFGP